MQYPALVQIGLVIVSLTIIFTYIRPTLAEIQVKQDEIAVYEDAVTKASEYNLLLNEKLSEEASISPADRNALEAFLPTELDLVQVIADVNTIATNQGLRVLSIGSNAEQEAAANVSFTDPGMMAALNLSLSTAELSVKVRGSYSSLKSFLAALESNQYLLELASLSVESESVIETLGSQPQRDYSLTLRIYAMPFANDSSNI